MLYILLCYLIIVNHSQSCAEVSRNNILARAFLRYLNSVCKLILIRELFFPSYFKFSLLLHDEIHPFIMINRSSYLIKFIRFWLRTIFIRDTQFPVLCIIHAAWVIIAVVIHTSADVYARLSSIVSSVFISTQRILLPRPRVSRFKSKWSALS